MHDLLKPITKKMIVQLQSARAIELSAPNGDRIITDSDFKGSMGGLFRRGLINTRMVMFQGKSTLQVYITEKGIDTLARYENVKIG
ncbi:MAG TPA: hypothetical protein VGP55_07690 [Chitinophagaceae bacterium]|nr:hypothetical protein [Chitinophagaceae bacterium]